MADRRYSTQAWKRLRLEVLARDGRACQLHGPRCTGRATTVHHIQPVAEGGAFFDPSNLQAACGPCNYGDGSRVASAKRRTAGQRITELEEQNYRLEQNVRWLEGRLEELAAALQAERDGPTAEAKTNGRQPAIR